MHEHPHQPGRQAGNANPFNEGLTSAGALHAVMSREIASRGSRTVQHKSYKFFYNPMWSHFGDWNGKPCGTYYYPKSTHLCYFWDMFDQVLLRPSLIDELREVRVLTSAGATRLTRANGHRMALMHQITCRLLLNLKSDEEFAMANNALDLWPDDIADASEGQSPVQLLKTQATAFTEKMRYSLRAEVVTDPSGGLLFHKFRIVAPALDNYAYELFRIGQPLTTFYPLQVLFNDAVYDIDSEQQLLDRIKEIFGAESTRRVIESLKGASS
jgi:hypothetical protein